ncbi:MAG: DUF4258 domain-containing protein [Anaerolineae bacterium]|nr:DUF4258 domain-containing protein [Anaerolineae bacterium]
MNEKFPINAKTVVFTKHARERMMLRRVSEDMAIQVMQNPDAIKRVEDGKIKFMGRSRGANVHVIGRTIPDENKWLVVSLWVRGEDDAGKPTHYRGYRGSKSMPTSVMFALLCLVVIIVVVALLYLSQGA